MISTRIIKASKGYKLVPYEVLNDTDVVFPEGTLIVKSDPIIDDEGFVKGFWIYTLIPTDAVLAEVKIDES